MPRIWARRTIKLLNIGGKLFDATIAVVRMSLLVLIFVKFCQQSIQVSKQHCSCWEERGSRSHGDLDWTRGTCCLESPPVSNSS